MKNFILAFFWLPILAWSLEAPFTLNGANALSNSAATLGNPAGANYGTGHLTTLGVHLEDNQEFQALHFSLQKNAAGFAYQYFEPSDESRFSASYSQPISDRLRLGLKFAYLASPGPNGFIGDVGASWEPFSFFKAGYYTQNLWHNFIGPKERAWQNASVGIRPLALFSSLGPYFAVAYEVNMPGFDNSFWDDRRESIFGDLGLMGWLRIQARIDLQESGNSSVGAFLQTSPNSLLGYFQKNQSSGDHFTSEIVHQFRVNSGKNSLGTPGGYVELDLNRQIIEGHASHSWFDKSRALGHLDVIKRIKHLETLRNVRVIVIKTGETECGMALAAHIRRALQDLKLKGKKLVAYMEYASNVNYFLASVADEVIMPPSTYFEVKGFGGEITFFKGLMDKAGVEAQFVRHGAYKSYPEIFTRDSMSEEWHSNMTQIYQSLWSVYLEEISKSRKISPDSLQGIFSAPSILVEEAVRAGLLDTLLYENQIVEYATGEKSRKINPIYGNRYKESWSPEAKIAVITVEGTITGGESTQGGFFTGKNSGSKTIRKEIQKAAKDPSIGATILRINSPGGSAIASDIIYQELMEYRSQGKPLIVSIGNTCASGGYYLASAGDIIVAENSSLVGSIGIFGGKFVTKGLQDKLSLTAQTIKVTPHADAASTSRKWNEEELEAIQNYMDTFYRRFVNVVEKGRKISADSLSHLAEGRIFTGKQALNNGLIDRLGDFQTGVEIAQFKMGLPKNSPVNLVSLSDLENEWLPLDPFQTKQNSPLMRDLANLEILSRSPQVWALSPEAYLFQ